MSYSNSEADEESDDDDDDDDDYVQLTLPWG